MPLPCKMWRTEAVMKRSDYAGWKEVFSFSLRQELKQKSFRGLLIVMCVLILVFVPVSTWLGQRGEEQEKDTEVSLLTIYDETGLNIDYTHALEGERYAAMQVVRVPGEGFEEHVKALEESEDSTELIVHIAYEEAGYFNLTFVKAATADLKDKDCDKLTQDFTDFFQDARISAVDVSPEQMEFINQPVETRIEHTTPEGEIAPEEEGEGISMTEYYVLLGGIVVVMLIVNMGGGQIAFSIVTEKSTRVVEYLMINVRPMALILGKILAALSTVMIQFATYGICYLISCGISGVLFGSGGAGAEQAPALEALFTGVNVGTVLLAVVMILAGVFFYSIVAGLAGASVSKMEEMAEGLKLYQMFLVIGSYIGIFLCIMQMLGKVSQTVVDICCIIPLSAPFVMPANLLLGKLSMSVALISLAVVILSTAGLFSFTAKVYESMIFYNGNVLKLKDILQIAKNRRLAANAVKRSGEEEKHHE